MSRVNKNKMQGIKAYKRGEEKGRCGELGESIDMYTPLCVK